jgi:hypothetical protein
MFSVTDFRGFVKAAANKAGKQILQRNRLSFQKIRQNPYLYLAQPFRSCYNRKMGSAASKRIEIQPLSYTPFQETI